ncbi:hypothetical protein Y032_0404g847 [Ancylostoma ceylanicum]|uniref:CCD97-like C-terminal domain-containing protein n=1 Tax=Ancylostoma ceylanicum TaxID=53326 RepID=A0A016X4Q3_9BILA|nr:hypothetical protein Y032_0404g847 [Ancylostoma ceylanicum]
MVGQIEVRKSDAQSLKTRRFLALQKLKEKGKYFSDEKMREREPYLYDVMVGKFISEEDRINLRPSVSREECAEGGWANILCQFESSREIAQRRNEHHTQWEREEKESRQSERLSRMEAHVSNMFSSREDEMEDEEEDLGDGLDELREEVNRISQENDRSLLLFDFYIFWRECNSKGNRYQRHRKGSPSSESAVRRTARVQLIQFSKKLRGAQYKVNLYIEEARPLWATSNKTSSAEKLQLRVINWIVINNMAFHGKKTEEMLCL